MSHRLSHQYAPKIPAFALWDVDDVPGLCADVLEKALSRSRHIEPEDYEDARTYLIETAIRLAARYDPKLDGKNPSFASYCGHILDLRVWSWFRTHFRDSRYVRCRHCNLREIEWRKKECSAPEGHERLGVEVPLAEAPEQEDPDWERREDDLLTRILLDDRAA